MFAGGKCRGREGSRRKDRERGVGKKIVVFTFLLSTVILTFCFPPNRLGQADVNRVIDAVHSAMQEKYRLLALPRTQLNDMVSVEENVEADLYRRQLLTDPS